MPLPVQTALLIDESGSMKGEAIGRGGRSPAFLEAMRPGTPPPCRRSTKVPHAPGFTDDQAALNASLAGSTPQKETALYDALLKSLASFGATTRDAADGISLRHLLSDGGDTASVATLDQAIAAVRSSNIQVYAIGLKTKEFDSAAAGEYRRSLGRPLPGDARPGGATDVRDAGQGDPQSVPADVHLPGRRRLARANWSSRSPPVGRRPNGERGFFYPESATTTSTALSSTTTVLDDVAPGVVGQPGWGRSDQSVPRLGRQRLRRGSRHLRHHLRSSIRDLRHPLPQTGRAQGIGDVLDNRRDLGPRAVDETEAQDGSSASGDGTVVGCAGLRASLAEAHR